MDGSSNQNGRKQQFFELRENRKEIAISKLLFPSTLLFLEKWGKNRMGWKEIGKIGSFRIHIGSLMRW